MPDPITDPDVDPVRQAAYEELRNRGVFKNDPVRAAAIQELVKRGVLRDASGGSSYSAQNAGNGTSAQPSTTPAVDPFWLGKANHLTPPSTPPVPANQLAVPPGTVTGMKRGQPVAPAFGSGDSRPWYDPAPSAPTPSNARAALLKSGALVPGGTLDQLRKAGAVIPGINPDAGPMGSGNVENTPAFIAQEAKGPGANRSRVRATPLTGYHGDNPAYSGVLSPSLPLKNRADTAMLSLAGNTLGTATGLGAGAIAGGAIEGLAAPALDALGTWAGSEGAPAIAPWLLKGAQQGVNLAKILGGVYAGAKTTEGTTQGLGAAMLDSDKSGKIRQFLAKDAEMRRQDPLGMALWENGAQILTGNPLHSALSERLMGAGIGYGGDVAMRALSGQKQDAGSSLIPSLIGLLAPGSLGEFGDQLHEAGAEGGADIANGIGKNVPLMADTARARIGGMLAGRNGSGTPLVNDSLVGRIAASRAGKPALFGGKATPADSAMPPVRPSVKSTLPAESLDATPDDWGTMHPDIARELGLPVQAPQQPTVPQNAAPAPVEPTVEATPTAKVPAQSAVRPPVAPTDNSPFVIEPEGPQAQEVAKQSPSPKLDSPGVAVAEAKPSTAATTEAVAKQAPTAAEPDLMRPIPDVVNEAVAKMQAKTGKAVPDDTKALITQAVGMGRDRATSAASQWQDYEIVPGSYDENSGRVKIISPKAPKSGPNQGLRPVYEVNVKTGASSDPDSRSYLNGIKGDESLYGTGKGLKGDGINTRLRAAGVPPEIRVLSKHTQIARELINQETGQKPAMPSDTLYYKSTPRPDNPQTLDYEKTKGGSYEVFDSKTGMTYGHARSEAGAKQMMDAISKGPRDLDAEDKAAIANHQPGQEITPTYEPGTRGYRANEQGTKDTYIADESGRMVPAPKSGEANRDFLDRRFDNIEEGQTPKDVARGADALVKRINFEAKVKGLDPDIAEAATDFVKMLPPQYLDKLGSSFHSSRSLNGDTGIGSYDPMTGLMSIARLGVNESSTGERVIPHEISHHLEQFVPEDDYKALQKQYTNEKAAKDNNIKRQADTLSAQAQVAKARGDITESNRLADQAVKIQQSRYRFTNFREWFAENITDRGLRDIFPPDATGTKKALYQRVTDHLRGVLTTLHDFLIRRGMPDKAEQVYKAFLSGKYANTRQRAAGDTPDFYDATDNKPLKDGEDPFESIPAAQPSAPKQQRPAPANSMEGTPFRKKTTPLPDQPNTDPFAAGYKPSPGKVKAMQDQAHADEQVAKVTKPPTLAQKAGKFVAETPQAISSIKQSLNLHFVFRHGGALLPSNIHNGVAGRSVEAMSKAIFGDKAAGLDGEQARDRMYKTISRDPDYKAMIGSGLKIDGIVERQIKARREADANAADIPYMAQPEDYTQNWGHTLVNKIPGAEATERGNRVYIDALRWHAFKAMKAEVDARAASGKLKGSPEENLQTLAQYINYATGKGDLARAGLSPEQAQATTKALRFLMMSPTYSASRVQMYADPAFRSGNNATARQMVMRSNLIHIASMGIGLALAHFLGAKIDPGGKIQIGNYHVDVSSGEFRNYKLLKDVVSAVYQRRGDLVTKSAYQYLRYSMNPAAGLVSDLVAPAFAPDRYDDKTAKALANEHTADKVPGGDYAALQANRVAEAATPMFVEDLYRTLREDNAESGKPTDFLSNMKNAPALFKPANMAASGAQFLGGSVNQYQPYTPKQKTDHALMQMLGGGMSKRDLGLPSAKAMTGMK